jgi:hypothetical protein
MKIFFQFFLDGEGKISDERKNEKNFGGSTYFLLLHTLTRINKR